MYLNRGLHASIECKHWMWISNNMGTLRGHSAIDFVTLKQNRAMGLLGNNIAFGIRKKKSLPCSSFPCFLGFPCFFAFQGIPYFFRPFFPSLPGILGVRKRQKILVFLVVFLAFPEKARKGRSGFGKGVVFSRKPLSRDSRKLRGSRILKISQTEEKLTFLLEVLEISRDSTRALW